MTKLEAIIYAIKTSEAIQENKKQELLDYIFTMKNALETIKGNIDYIIEELEDK